MITNAEYIYGDTDSVFFTFNLKDEHGEPVRGKKALEVTIELAKEAGELATKFLKKPTIWNMKKHSCHSACFQKEICWYALRRRSQ